MANSFTIDKSDLLLSLQSELNECKDPCGRTFLTEDQCVYLIDLVRGFCMNCGASIPHREGEGRCQYCMQHLSEQDKK